MTNYEAIILERHGTTAVIRLNRPEKHNAISRKMSAELIDCLDALEADDAVRVIVLTGAGDKAFCAGADMAQAHLRTATTPRISAATGRRRQRSASPASRSRYSPPSTATATAAAQSSPSPATSASAPTTHGSASSARATGWSWAASRLPRDRRAGRWRRS